MRKRQLRLHHSFKLQQVLQPGPFACAPLACSGAWLSFQTALPGGLSLLHFRGNLPCPSAPTDVAGLKEKLLPTGIPNSLEAELPSSAEPGTQLFQRHRGSRFPEQHSAPLPVRPFLHFQSATSQLLQLRQGGSGGASTHLAESHTQQILPAQQHGEKCRTQQRQVRTAGSSRQQASGIT